MSDLLLKLVFIISMSSAKAEYPCVCNYNVEQSVLPNPSAQAQPIGYVYEFDCKPTYPLTNLDKDSWYSIIYNGQVAYLQKNSNAEEMACAGQPAPEDRITTKASPANLTYSTTPATQVSKKVSTNTTRQLNTTQIHGLFSYRTNTTPQRTTVSPMLSASYSTTMTTVQASLKTSVLPNSTSSQKEIMTTSATHKNDILTTNSDYDGLFTKYTTIKPLISSANTIQAFSNVSRIDQKKSSLPTYSFYTSSPSSESLHSSVGPNTTSPSSTRQALLGITTGTGLVSSTTGTIFSTSQTPKVLTTSRNSVKQTTGKINTELTSLKQTPRPNTTDYLSSTQASVPITIGLISSTQTPSEITTHSSSIQTTESIKNSLTYSSQLINISPGQNLTGYSSSAQTPATITFIQSTSNQRTEVIQLSRSPSIQTNDTSAEPDIQSSSTQVTGAKRTSRSSSTQTIDAFSAQGTAGHSSSTQMLGAFTPIHNSSSQPIDASSVAKTTSRSFSTHTVNRSMVPTSTWSISWTPTQILSLSTTDALLFKISNKTEIYSPVTSGAMPRTIATTTPRPTTPSTIGDVSLCGQKLFQYTREDEGALTQYGNRCYELVPFKLIWTKAEFDCQAKGGHLLSVHSSHFQEYIYNWIKRFSGIPAVWLGLFSKRQDGIYRWISGEHLGTSFWYSGLSQSKKNDTEECGLMVFSPPFSGQWETVSCGETTPTGDRGSQNAFICEFPIESNIITGQIIGK